MSATTAVMILWGLVGMFIFLPIIVTIWKRLR